MTSVAVSGCDQLVVGPTHARGGTLDLLMTDVPDLVRLAVVAPIGNSDHSSLSAVISMAQAVPNMCVSRKVLLKHQVNWNTVCCIGILPAVLSGNSANYQPISITSVLSKVFERLVSVHLG